MAEFYSYEPHLKRICLARKPRLALEWGPGRSTEIILENSDAQIISIEHDLRHFEACRRKFEGNRRVRLVHKTTSVPLGGSQAYATYPIYTGKLFDLIVVDGRQRCDCVAVSALVLRSNGIVLLHDSERENYHAAYQFFEQVEELGGTALLTHSTLRLAKRNRRSRERAPVDQMTDGLTSRPGRSKRE